MFPFTYLVWSYSMCSVIYGVHVNSFCKTEHRGVRRKQIVSALNFCLLRRTFLAFCVALKSLETDITARIRNVRETAQWH